MNKLKRMLSRHHRMVDLILAGLTNKEIAERLNCTPQNVSLVHKSPVVQAELARRRENIEKKTDSNLGVAIQDAEMILQKNAKDAAQVHVDLLKSEDESVQQRSANAILDRVGIHGRGQDSGGKTIVIETDQVNLLQIAMQESKKEVIDIQPPAPADLT